MSAQISAWLAEAEAVLAAGSDDAAVLRLMASCRSLTIDESSLRDVDAVQLGRVIDAMTAECADLQVEIADVVNRRGVLRRSKAGMTGYVTAVSYAP